MRGITTTVLLLASLGIASSRGNAAPPPPETRPGGAVPVASVPKWIDLVRPELEGWRVVGGTGRFDLVDGAIRGVGEPRANTFLVTERSFGDFVLEAEVQVNDAGNSGIQVRARAPFDRDGRLSGYQIEVDPSERAWSGGLYDEGRRGWIHPLEGDDRARGAFRRGEWNHYRIECVGPRIRSWVNGVACADVVDLLDVAGPVALQAHSGDCTVRFRNVRIADMGTRAWRPIFREDRLPTPSWRRTEDGGLRADRVLSRLDGLVVADGRGDATIRLRVRVGSGALAIEPFAFDATAPVGSPSLPVRPRIVIRGGEKPVVSTEGFGSIGAALERPVTDPKPEARDRPAGEHEIVIDLDRASRRLVVLVDGVAVERRAFEGVLALAPTVLGIEGGANDVMLLAFEELVAE